MITMSVRRPVIRWGTTTRRQAGALAVVAALATGAVAAGTAVPADAAAPRQKPGPTAPASAIALERTRVLTGISVVGNRLRSTERRLRTVALPPRALDRVVALLGTSRATLGRAQAAAVTARTSTQLSAASALTASVAQDGYADVVDLLARAQAVKDGLAALAPEQAMLEERAQAGEYWGWDVSTWADPLRNGVAQSDSATTLADTAIARMSASGTATAQDEADVAAAESGLSSATDLTTQARTAWDALNAT